MNFSSAVQWWDEWQLRVLVLGSLFIQFFLSFSTAVRRLPLPPWFRVFMWLAYLGGDALPIYSLATLFNRHKMKSPTFNESSLEVLWAPVLLIHLGGQHQMTAYNIEDNELWMRHAITAVSQIAVALYVFCKSWSGEKGLLQAAILLFVVGIVRTSQKPWDLKSGSISNMVTSSSLSSRREHNRVVSCCFVCNNTTGFFLSKKGREEEAAEEKDIPLEEFVKQVCILVSELPSDQPSSQQEEIQEEIGKYIQTTAEHYVYRLLVDISAPYSARIKNLQLLIAIGNQYAIQIRYVLDLAFVQLYTKITSFTGICLHFLLPFLTLASVIIFSTSHKYYDYDAKDVKVTYILFICTALLDFLEILFSLNGGAKASDKLSQYSLLSFYARKKRPTILMKLAAVFCCKDYVNMHCYIEQALKFSPQITDLVLGYVKDGWKEFIHDATTYRRFNNHRGQWTLRRHLLDSEQRLGWSLNMAFDRGVLLWHVATDLCFHHQTTTPDGQERAARSRFMSHYMAYLLFIRPEMLMPGTRSGIFSVACDDVELMLVGKLALDERGFAQEILRRAQQSPSLDIIEIGALIPNACRLAEALMELCNEEERWKVIQGVWVEMLCYSASRCRGYLHAKNMSEGTELLSRVWVLLSFMGMETFADRFQKPEPPKTEEGVEEGDGGEGRATETEVDAIV